MKRLEPEADRFNPYKADAKMVGVLKLSHFPFLSIMYGDNLPTFYGSKIQGVYKLMVQFQKLTRNLFLTLQGQNVHRQQRQLSKFLMRYRQFARSCLLRGRGVSFQDGVAAGKGFLCAPF